MRKLTSYVLICLIMIGLIAVGTPCFAQDMLRKLGRGLGNVATGAFEIPKSVQETFYEEGPLAAGTYGVIDGISKFLLRTVVGVYEVVSFPIPFPADYAPIVEPEFLFGPDEDARSGRIGY